MYLSVSLLGYVTYGDSLRDSVIPSLQVSSLLFRAQEKKFKALVSIDNIYHFTHSAMVRCRTVRIPKELKNAFFSQSIKTQTEKKFSDHATNE